MDSINIFQNGSAWPVKIYFCLVHVLLLSVLLYMFLYSRKNNKDSKHPQRKGTRTFKRGNRAVTSESCEWLNSILQWCYLHSAAKNTPDLLKMWIRNLNRSLYKKRTNNQRIFITNLRPNSLPPKLTSVYCLTVDGKMQCITFHVESSDIGFHVHVNQPTKNGRSKNVILEVNVVRLSGEVALQLSEFPYEAKIMFIGEPEIEFTTRAITKDGIDADAVDAVEEKVKEVICKTVTNVPLAETTKPDTDTQSNGSAKDKLDSPILQTCVGEEGKLLVKVIKATGLCSKDKSVTTSPYCIISADNPYQRKRTSLMKETNNPFWNEYFAFDITSKTREITLNIFDFEKTPSDANYHMDDNELSAEQDDFLGQAIVPLATINRNQTCRLILPILPKTNKCDYVKGELSLEFTFDKDGKVIDGALPLVDVTDAKATAVEHAVYDVTVEKTQAAPSETPSVNKGYTGAYAYSLDKSYMETSLDELAQEIEAYEAGTTPTRVVPVEEKPVEKPVEILMEMKPVEEKQSEKQEQEHAEAMEEAAVLDATLPQLAIQAEDVEDNKPKEEQETPEPKPKAKKSLFKRRPKSTVEGEKPEKEPENNRHSYHAGDQPIDETPENEPKEEEPTDEAEDVAVELNREPKSKIRRSFNMKFKRSSKKDKESPTEPDAPKEESHDEKKEQEAVEESLKSDPPKSRFSGRFKRKKQQNKTDEKEEKKDETKEEEKDETHEEKKDEENAENKENAPKEESHDDKQESVEEESSKSDPPKSRFSGRFKRKKQQNKDDEKEEKKEENEEKNEENKEEESKPEKKELETVDENAEASPSEKPSDEPKSRFRKLNLKRGNKRPVSMIADTKPIDPIDEELKRDPVTHSYHAGDLPETSQLRKSNSQSSLLSYSPNPFSSLVIEVKDKGEKKYYHIPVSMAKRGTYEQKGVKYHVYNDHMFKAVHFDESTNCSVCGSSIGGLFGKQGYQCKGCKLSTHKKCHFQTSDMCSANAAKNVDIIKAPTIVGN